MKVLFVDDEEAILSGLRRMLRRHAAGWEMSFAVGGEAALRQLRDERFDVVVTDMRMPGIDGAGVLDAVRRDHPGTVRIVLSGHNEMAAALRTVPLAHQFLTKPCDPDELKGAVSRATKLQEVLTRTELLPVIGGIDTLPSPPKVITELNSLLAAPEVDIDKVVKVVSSDAAISAKLLQLVNSAFFGVARRVGDVGTAVRYLGIVIVRDLAMAVHAFEAMGGGVARSLVADIHAHSGQVAQITQLLVRDNRNCHEAYVAALLHDVGRLVLASRASSEYLAVVAGSRDSGRSLLELESEAFGADHAKVGALFLSMWGLPYAIVEVVLGHHTHREPADPLSTADATYAAELLSNSALLANNESRVCEGCLEEPPPELLALPSVARTLREWNGQEEPS